METLVAGVAESDSIPESIVNTGKTTKNPFKSFSKWYSRLTPFKRLTFISVSFLILIILAGGGIYGYIIYKGYSNNNLAAKKNGVQQMATPTPTPTPISAVDPLTGVTYTGTPANNMNRPPLAVMIENSIPSRPQKGLNQADLVYETLAEGGITRFMAVFLGNTPSLVGPVRSARTYFLDWVNEYNAIYAHWGENSDVPALLTQYNIRNIDAIVQPGTDQSCPTATGLFCRDYNRTAPDNGYGFPQQIWSYGANQGWTNASTFTSWQFKDDAITTGRGTDQSALSIDFMPGDEFYSVKWVYDKTNNDYVRYDNGQVQVDALDNSQITAKNIVVEFVDGNLYTSSGGKEVYHLNNVGTGKASIFIDGQEVDGTWTKNSETGRTTFTDASGKAVQFDKGKTWITVLVNNQGSFNYSN